MFIERFNFLKTFTNRLCLLALLFLSVACRAQSDTNKKLAKKKPNIIYVMADDLGYGDLGVYGQEKIKTPNIDQMALEGIKFNRHYAGSTVCMPSRASLMTGFHMGHSTVRGNPRWTASGKPIDIRPGDVTVAEELKRAGYNTAIIGKWGLAEADTKSMPLNQGFDYFFGYRKHKTAHHYYPDTLYENNKPFYTGNMTHEKIGVYSHDLFVNKALQYVKEKKDVPFFLYLAFTLPHYELTVPEESKEPYKRKNWEERTLKSRKGGYQHDEDGNATYAGMVSRMDRDMGRLFALLKSLNIDENTLVIFTSDNGHEYDRGFFNSNGVFKGHKRDLYEGGIRIPFIARWPRQITPGSETDHISAFWDFLPTACDIAGIDPTEKDLDGISYLPTLLGEPGQKKHEYLYWEFNEWEGPIQAIRKGKWKAIRILNKPVELYDLETDKREEHDLAAEHPEIVAEMEALFNEARTDDPNFVLKFHPRLKK
ncbi:arylsulfatase [Christiangramia crocea]|uniref:Arylsulfatase n=1 Tax=Christiangramia crocea TaxID=2904124 RepID=A0A9X1UYJ1_9FLAO|nr:arylsulfatase [Gramella crocea]MCG9972561.1 arylsulfatase [Gramella crocea]